MPRLTILMYRAERWMTKKYNFAANFAYYWWERRVPLRAAYDLAGRVVE